MICVVVRDPVTRLTALAAMCGVTACAAGRVAPTSPNPSAVGSIVLSPAAPVVGINGTVQIDAVVRGTTGAVITGKQVTWSSSDLTKATVTNGVVTGVATGFATIVAQSESKSDSVTVKVGAPAEARALWVTRFEYNSAAKIIEILDKAKSANLNVVFFQVRGAGDAFYVSQLEPCAASLCGKLGAGPPPYDPLDVAVREAHARGLQLHAYINALAGWGSGSAASCAVLANADSRAPRHVLIDHPEWAMVHSSGAAQTCPNAEEYVYLSPGNAGVRTWLARVAADIVRRYQVDGIHLDRIRYPGTAWSHDTASLRLFGRDPATNSADWSSFRRGLINQTVKETYDSVKAVRPSVQLSAAVWGIYQDKWSWSSSQGQSQYMQDPRAWTAGGYLDVAVPMTYYTIAGTYCAFADWACLVDDHVQGIQSATGKPVWMGTLADKGTTEIVKQIELGRRRGARGFSIFSYSSAESAGLWSALASGPFSHGAIMP